MPVRVHRFVCLYCLRQEIDKSCWKEHVTNNMVYQKFNEIRIADSNKLQTLNWAN